MPRKQHNYYSYTPVFYPREGFTRLTDYHAEEQRSQRKDLRMSYARSQRREKKKEFFICGLSFMHPLMGTPIKVYKQDKLLSAVAGQ
jgi:hypothetical protein